MMTEERIKELEEKGFKRWTKGNLDRLYINASQLGLVCEYYKTGNISDAEFDGVQISNSRAYKMKGAKTYVDIKTGTVHSTDEWLKEKAEELLEEED